MLLDQVFEESVKVSEVILGSPFRGAGDNISTSSASSDTVKESGSGFFEAFKVGDKLKRVQILAWPIAMTYTWS